MKHEWNFTKTILRYGLARIELGWCKNALRLGDKYYCAIGAISDFDDMSDLGQPRADRDALNALYASLPSKGSFIDKRAAVVAYNNAPETTQDDVVALFQRAIDF